MLQLNAHYLWPADATTSSDLPGSVRYQHIFDSGERPSSAKTRHSLLLSARHANLSTSLENMVPLPAQFKDLQGKVVRGDFYWIDVLLHDGTVYKGLTTNGREIRGTWDGKGVGSWEHPVPFKAEDIRRVRPHSSWPFREQFLSFFAPRG